MSIPTRIIGQTPRGESVEEFTLESGSGVRARVLSWGATLASLEAPDRNGDAREITLGFDGLEGWLGGHPYFGSTVGRYGNRIAGARFALGGVEHRLTANEGANQLHGGVEGFDKKVWTASDVSGSDGPAVELALVSPDGDEGFPGELLVCVRYTLGDGGELRIDYEATTDRPTHVNLTNHTYWNLAGAGSGDVLAHELMLRASRYLPVGEGSIPTGELRDVAGTPYDFRSAAAVGRRIDATGGGYDLCYVVDGEAGELRPAAAVRDPASGRSLEVWTTEPGIQLYTANSLDGLAGRGGASFEKHGGFCLEAQHFPDSPNRPEFPSTILVPGETYRQTTSHRFGVR
jgi:aldose 1-epimerase